MATPTDHATTTRKTMPARENFTACAPSVATTMPHCLLLALAIHGCILLPRCNLGTVAGERASDLLGEDTKRQWDEGGWSGEPSAHPPAACSLQLLASSPCTVLESTTTDHGYRCPCPAGVVVWWWRSGTGVAAQRLEWLLAAGRASCGQHCGGAWPAGARTRRGHLNTDCGRRAGVYR